MKNAIKNILGLFLLTSVVSIVCAVLAVLFFGDLVDFFTCYAVLEAFLMFGVLDAYFGDGSFSKELDVSNKAVFYNTDRGTARVISDLEDINERLNNSKGTTDNK